MHNCVEELQISTALQGVYAGEIIDDVRGVFGLIDVEAHSSVTSVRASASRPCLSAASSR